jgi:iron(III)-enterobactin esterase
MNSDYAEFIETEVLPRVEKDTNVKLTKDPDGRAARGNSSGGSAALIIGEFMNLVRDLIGSGNPTDR